MNKINWIDMNLILIFYKKIFEFTGGSYGIKDYNIISSAIQMPFQTFENKNLYETIEKKIAIFTYSLIKNHPFIDGNKRVGIGLMLLLLEINGINIMHTQDEIVNIAIGIANGQINNKDIEFWIIHHKI